MHARRSVALAASLALSCSADGPRARTVTPIASASASGIVPAAPPACAAGFAVRGGVCKRVAPRLSTDGRAVCAALVDGRVFCWGVGIPDPHGVPGAPAFSPIPVEMPGVHDAIDVSVGFELCAIRDGGGVTCWSGDPLRAEPMGALAGVVRVIAGSTGSWALSADHRARSFVPGDPSKSVVVADPDVHDLVARGGPMCVLHGDHTVDCFSPNARAYEMPDLPRIERFHVEPVWGTHICGVGVDGDFYCWADSDLVASTTPKRPPQPRVWSDLRGATSIAVTEDARCGLFDGGIVRCTDAELGTTLGAKFADPVNQEITAFHRAVDQGADDDPPVELYGAGYVLCATYASGHVRCVGVTRDGALGTGESGLRYTPKPVPGVSHASAIILAQSGGCAAVPGARPICWGFADGTGVAPREVDGPTDIDHFGRDVAEGFRPTAITKSGELWYLGEERSPDGAGTGRDVAMSKVAGLPAVQDASGVDPHFRLDLAVTKAGTVIAFAAAAYEDGGRPAYRATTAAIEGLTNVRVVRQWNGQACALRTNGTVACWKVISPFPGRHSEGKFVPDKEATRPGLLEIGSIDRAEELVIGRGGFCARQKDHKVRCWMMRDASNVTPKKGATPSRLELALEDERTTFEGAITLDGGTGFAALTERGTCVYEGFSVRHSFEFEVACPEVTAVSIARESACLLLRNGDVECWGEAGNGILGTNERSVVFDGVDAVLPAVLAP